MNAQTVGEGVFCLLLFSCRPFGIHFHIHTLDEHLYSSIIVLPKHAKCLQLNWRKLTFLNSSLHTVIDMFYC